jgi:hypothetical protein
MSDIVLEENRILSLHQQLSSDRRGGLECTGKSGSSRGNIPVGKRPPLSRGVNSQQLEPMDLNYEEVKSALLAKNKIEARRQEVDTEISCRTDEQLRRQVERQRQEADGEEIKAFEIFRGGEPDEPTPKNARETGSRTPAFLRSIENDIIAAIGSQKKKGGKDRLHERRSNSLVSEDLARIYKGKGNAFSQPQDSIHFHQFGGFKSIRDQDSYENRLNATDFETTSPRNGIRDRLKEVQPIGNFQQASNAQSKIDRGGQSERIGTVLNRTKDLLKIYKNREKASGLKGNSVLEVNLASNRRHSASGTGNHGMAQDWTKIARKQSRK